MKVTANSQIYFGFLCGIILPLCLQLGLTATEDASMSPSVLPTQIPTSPIPMEPSTTVVSQEILTTLTSLETTASTTQITTFEATSLVQTTTPPMQSPTSPSPSTETATSLPLPSAPPPDLPTSSYPATGSDQESVTPGENQVKAELCEEKHKRLMLICLIIIGLLVFLCVCLLLVIVSIASKLSHTRRCQASRRLPRSNGDFLSATSLWPTGLETLQRMTTETTETSLAPLGPGLERRTTGQGKTGEEASRKLASEISIRQKHKETSPKETQAEPHNSIVTKVEI